MVANLIKQGDNDELIPLLYDKVKKLMYMKADCAYKLYKRQCDKTGVELSDIRQICYPAYLKALDGYKPEQGYKFTAYIQYPFKNALNELLGLRGKSNLLNKSISLNVPLKQDEEISLLELIEDCTSRDDFDCVETEDEAMYIREAVNRLPEIQKKVIHSYFWDNKTYKLIADEMNLSIHKVRSTEAKALINLRKDKKLRSLYREYNHHTKWVQFSNLQNKPQCFDFIQDINKKQHKFVIYH